MPIESIVILSAIVIAFSAFAVVMAWADAQTRGLSK
jgi:multisubunit Na+/H+ antiporter MnhC subunit